MNAMQKILNLTQHAATPEQSAAGVVEPDDKAAVADLLNFATLPSAEHLRSRAEALASLAARSGAGVAMIGGAPFFMAPLERALMDRGVKPVYAFSMRESVEVTAADGSVTKRSVFRHEGFVEACV